MKRETQLRIEIENVKNIQDKTQHPGEKIAALYLEKRLKSKLLNLMFPKPKEL